MVFLSVADASKDPKLGSCKEMKRSRYSLMARIRVFTKIRVYSGALDVINAVNGGPD